MAGYLDKKRRKKRFLGLKIGFPKLFVKFFSFGHNFGHISILVIFRLREVTDLGISPKKTNEKTVTKSENTARSLLCQ